MTDNEIDFELALAIGYTSDRVKHHPITRAVYVANDADRCDGPMYYSGWQRFDHKDPTVIWHIAEQYDAFPYLLRDRKPDCVWNAIVGDSTIERQSVCAATATALAVIEHCKKGAKP